LLEVLIRFPRGRIEFAGRSVCLDLAIPQIRDVFLDPPGEILSFRSGQPHHLRLKFPHSHVFKLRSMRANAIAARRPQGHRIAGHTHAFPSAG
jgi:hypothetical protein